MIKVQFDSSEVSKTLNNVISYSLGFTRGVKIAQPEFNRDLGFFVKEALEKYIDAKARGNPQSLHHMYEWNMVGNPAGRLFEISVSYTQEFIKFAVTFLPSRVASESSSEPFVDKARIMENEITITISPENSEFLVFEDDGETIFTRDQVVIENPGGTEVGRSFLRTVSDFFNNYLTVSLLKTSGIFDKLKYAKEYSRRFVQGSKVGGSAGVSAGKEYLTIGGVRIE